MRLVGRSTRRSPSFAARSAEPEAVQLTTEADVVTVDPLVAESDTLPESCVLPFQQLPWRVEEVEAHGDAVEGRHTPRSRRTETPRTEDRPTADHHC